MTRNRSTLTKASSLALAGALAAQAAPAAAQSLLGTPTVASGSANIVEGPGTTDISFDASQTVIDWTPDDNLVGNFGGINFQSAGTTATFSSTGDFAVLNRVNVADPGRIVAMNGTINSLVNGKTGGSVFFYSPSGFVIGSSAIINVGSLVLSASPISVDGNGNFINGSTVTFNQAPNPNAAVNTVAGSQISANGAGNYVALVAPSITHGGTIRTDTAAALIAAEAATINFSPDGLFDVQVTVGTDSATGIDVNGGTITRNNPADGGNHYAYLMAVAKNDAVAMLVRGGGSVGFETATSALVESNGVVILGGTDLSTGQSAGNPGVPVNLTVDDASFSSNTNAYLSGNASITSASGATDFGASLLIQTQGDVRIAAEGGNALSIAGDLGVTAYQFGPDASSIGQTILLGSYQGSDFTIGGNADLMASSFGGFNPATPGDATGGTVTIQAGTGGSILVSGDLDVTAEGHGSMTDGEVRGGHGTGGLIQLLANNGGSTVTVRGDTSLSVEGEGGTTLECSSCAITGGDGTGGRVEIFATQGLDNSIVLGALDVDATGNAGAGDVTGGVGTGGSFQMTSATSAITVGSSFNVNANGTGGYGFDTGAAGDGFGGDIVINFLGSGGTIDLEGDTFLSADGFGQFGLTGGNATGGDINIQAGVGGFLTAGLIFANADGNAGSGDDTGGNGQGGTVLAQAITGGTLDLDSLSLSASGSGGSGFTGAGGTGRGGRVVASADGATTTLIGNLFLSADGRGGGAAGDGTTGGLGTGGQADVFSDHAGFMSVGGIVSAEAIGSGGGNFQESAFAGDGQGGKVFFQASNGASLDAASDVFLDASGRGGFSGGDCSDCGGGGGDGTGGTVTVQVYGGTESFIGVGEDLQLVADGIGSDGFGGAGGNGTGGHSQVVVNESGDIDVIGDLTLTAEGLGGWQTNGLAAGNATGGTAELFFDASNGLLTVGGVGFIDADGFGGQSTGGSGGNALGGLARILSTGGTANFQGDLRVRASASGGSADGGTGGDAQSGMARVRTIGGNVTVGGDLTLESISTGGDGDNGGDAIAVIGNDPRNTSISDARVVAENGTISVTGFTTLDVSAQGGQGANGGSGGNASAGYGTVHANNSDNGTSAVTVADLLVIADATGGSGGTGAPGISPDNGGKGGNASGGYIAVTAAAGNGTLSAGTVNASASAFGGDGGDGSNSEGPAGGDGGLGGTARGGTVYVGTESGPAVALASNDGSATISSAFMVADATGGSGGWAGFGTPNGTAADGGDAIGGDAILLVRGSDLTIGTVIMDASATGGTGGFTPFEAPEGTGGDATTGTLNVVVTNRASLPAQRGSLSADLIFGTATATGGSGAVNGGSWTLGGSTFEVTNADAAIGSVSLTIAADGLDPSAAQTFSNPIVIAGGTADVSGGFTFETPAVVSVYADNGMLNAAAITISGGDYIHDDTRPAPINAGILNAAQFDLSTGGDLIVDAHILSVNGLGLTAPGLIDLEDVTSTTGAIDIRADGGSLTAADLSAAGGIHLEAATSASAGNAQAGNGFESYAFGGSSSFGDIDAGNFLVVSSAGNILTGNLDGGDFVFVNATAGSISAGSVTGGTRVDLEATGGITAGDLLAIGDFAYARADNGPLVVGNVDAATSINLLSLLGPITAGNLDSGTATGLEADGDIAFGNVNAGTDLDFDTGGSVTGGNVIAGTHAGGQAGGSLVLGDITAGLAGPSPDGASIGMAAATSVTVGDVQGVESVGFASFGDIITGSIETGGNFLAFAGANMNFGSITTAPDGRIYLADASMFIDAGGVDNFDPSIPLALAPVATGGSITIGGPVSTGIFQAAAGTNLTTGAISAQSIEASAGGLASINGIWSAPFVQLLSDDIDIGASGGIDAGTTGSVILASTNATQALIGDGLTGTGYRLTNAEFARISSGSLTIAARGDATAAADMLIGDLDITGPMAGSTIDDPNGSVFFATGDLATETPGGVIRVDGAVHATGFTATNALDFTTGRFELNADTGSLVVESAPGILGGIIDITAGRIHVASAQVLQKLGNDPHYNGYVNDLATPIANARPGGVINAATIYVSPTQAVLVQNTGTADLPAGFKAGFVELFPPEGAAPGSIELIVNGQLVTQAGPRTGILVRDDLVVDLDLSVYLAGSTINGCVLVGVCGAVEPPPPPPFFPPGFTPTPGIQDEITLVDNDVLPPPTFGNEDFIDDNDEATEDGATSPIEPPQPLFDTSALGDKGDIDDPVSGSGNPALMDGPPPPPTGKEDQQ